MIASIFTKYIDISVDYNILSQSHNALDETLSSKLIAFSISNTCA